MAAERRIRQSLLQPPFFLGVTFEVLLAEIALLLGLFVALGASKVVLVYAALTLIVVHPVLARLVHRDPLALSLLVASFGYRRWYPARGSLLPVASFKPRPCLPRV